MGGEGHGRTYKDQEEELLPRQKTLPPEKGKSLSAEGAFSNANGRGVVPHDLR